MRDTLEAIDHIDPTNTKLTRAFYSVAAQQIATQALALAAMRGQEITPSSAKEWVEAVGGYVGVTGHRIKGGPRTIGEQATKFLTRLIELPKIET